MDMTRRELIGGTAAVALAAHAPAWAADTPADARTRMLLDRMAETLLAEYPENATIIGLDTGARAPLRAQLTDRGAAAEASRARACGERLAQLKAVDRKRLSPAVALDVDVTQAAHELAADGWRRLGPGDVAILNQNVSFRSTPYIVSQLAGAAVDVPDMLESQHTVETAADADAYLARIEAFARSLDDESARIAGAAQAGTALPRFLSALTIAQQRRFRESGPAGWGFVTALADKAKAAGLPARYAAAAARLAADRVAPAVERQIAALEAAAPRGHDEPGMWTLPGGADRYAWLVEAGTTTRRSPDELHRLGIEQNRALTAEMDALLKAQGLTTGTVGARLTALGKRPDLLFANDDAGRAKLLAYLNGVLGEVRRRMPQAFDRLTRGRVLIRRVPPAIESGAPNGYAGAGSIDGKVPGMYNINLKDTAIWPRYALPTLTFHEAIPGHIWQGEYSRSLPLIRSLLAFNAFSEGWGLYAEQLGDEVGMYADDPLGRIGYLQSINFRACRLVLDTGLHAKRWTFEQAMDWFGQASGLPEAQRRSELTRYCAMPGQACGYKVGHNEINRLRDKARAALGPRWDVKAYNDMVVALGGVPMTLLERVVDMHIKERRG